MITASRSFFGVGELILSLPIYTPKKEQKEQKNEKKKIYKQNIICLFNNNLLLIFQ